MDNIQNELENLELFFNSLQVKQTNAPRHQDAYQAHQDYLLKRVVQQPQMSKQPKPHISK